MAAVKLVDRAYQSVNTALGIAGCDMILFVATVADIDIKATSIINAMFFILLIDYRNNVLLCIPNSHPDLVNSMTMCCLILMPDKSFEKFSGYTGSSPVITL